MAFNFSMLNQQKCVYNIHLVIVISQKAPYDIIRRDLFHELTKLFDELLEKMKYLEESLFPWWKHHHKTVRISFSVGSLPMKF